MIQAVSHGRKRISWFLMLFAVCQHLFQSGLVFAIRFRPWLTAWIIGPELTAEQRVCCGQRFDIW